MIFWKGRNEVHFQINFLQQNTKTSLFELARYLEKRQQIPLNHFPKIAPIISIGKNEFIHLGNERKYKRPSLSLILLINPTNLDF